MQKDLSLKGCATGFILTLSGLLLMSLNAFAGTYYIAASGSDSNNGTSKSTPWLHAPGMPNCTASCRSYTPAAGDQFILRGGDTWHFGNSSASPYTGGTWTWEWNGSSGSRIYVGVDTAWYSGGSWSRPILTGDNATSSSTTLGACSYHSGSSNILVSFANVQYTTVDNFEMTGLCQDSVNAPFGHDIYFQAAGSPVNLIVQNLYIHGWTHQQFTCTSGGTGICVNIELFLTGGTTVVQYVIVDGADSDPTAAITFGPGSSIYNLSYSVIRNVSGMNGNGCHLLHDNLFDSIVSVPLNNGHANIYECESGGSGTNAFYNNLIQHIYVTGPAGVGIWPSPPVGAHDYWFNNVIYDQHSGGNYFDIGQNNGDQGTMLIFNNTFEQPVNGNVIFACSANGYAKPFTAVNNHYIIDGASPYSASCSGQGTLVTELAQTHATASGQGYTSAATFAYSPASSGASTVGTGTSEITNFCAALTTAAGSDSTLSDAASACQSETRYACTYNTSNHTISCPARTVVPRPSSGAWNIGAYQLSGSSPSNVNPPTGLSAVVR